MPSVEELEKDFRECEARYLDHQHKGEELYSSLDIAYARLMSAKTGIDNGSVVEACDMRGKSFRGVFRGWYYSESIGSLVRVIPLKKSGEPSLNVRLVYARDMKPVSDREA